MILVAIYFICRESLAFELGRVSVRSDQNATKCDKMRQNATKIYKSQEFVVRFLFAFRDKYITLDADGEETVKSCPCCHSPPAEHFHTVLQGMIKSDWIIVSDLVRSCQILSYDCAYGVTMHHVSQMCLQKIPIEVMLLLAEHFYIVLPHQY